MSSVLLKRQVRSVTALKNRKSQLKLLLEHDWNFVVVELDYCTTHVARGVKERSHIVCSERSEAYILEKKIGVKQIDVDILYIDQHPIHFHAGFP